MKKPAHDKRIKGPRGDHDSPRGVIVHTTEGTPRPGPSDRHGVIDYLADTRNLSVPFVADDEGITQMVPDGYHGEHAACVNGCLGIEQIGTAFWTKEDWKAHDDTVKHSAQIAAWFLAEVLGVAVNRRNLKKLVVGHDRDHVFGGCSDHWDPGPNYPWKRFRRYAIAYAKTKKYRVVAIKGERKRVREFRARRFDQMLAWIAKRLRSGFTVRTRRVRGTWGE